MQEADETSQVIINALKKMINDCASLLDITRKTTMSFHKFIAASVAKSVGMRVATELMKREVNTEQFEASVEMVNKIIKEEAEKLEIAESTTTP